MMRCAGHVAPVGEMRNVQFLVENSKRKRSFRRPWITREYNIKMNLKLIFGPIWTALIWLRKGNV
jgi:hypothetical protein